MSQVITICGSRQVSNDAKNGVEVKPWRRSLPKRISFRNSKPQNRNSVDKECQTDGQVREFSPDEIRDQTPVKIFGLSPRSCDDETSPISVDNESPTSTSTSFNLERSQSLRISKHSLRKISKGGSLRFVKKLQA